MKILIVDDNAENLNAAKEAAKKFPEHEFLFTNSAKKAASLIAKVSAIITDLFFPDENHNNKSKLAKYYDIYRTMMFGNKAYDEVVRKYYGGERRRAEEKREDVMAIMEDGTINRMVERLLQHFEKDGYQDGANEQREILKNLPSPQFPYGGALMLLAHDLGKKLCLVSDIHRHASVYRNAATAIDAMMLLLPLMNDPIITVEQAIYDGQDSLVYLGEDEISHVDDVKKSRDWNRGSKTFPGVWAEAIRRILNQ